MEEERLPDREADLFLGSVLHERLSLLSQSFPRRSSQRRSSLASIASTSSTASNAEFLAGMRDFERLERDYWEGDVDVHAYRGRAQGLLRCMETKLSEAMQRQMDVEAELDELESYRKANKLLREQLDKLNAKLKLVTKERDEARAARRLELSRLSDIALMLNQRVQELNDNFEESESESESEENEEEVREQEEEEQEQEVESEENEENEEDEEKEKESEANNKDDTVDLAALHAHNETNDDARIRSEESERDNDDG